jgi:hypothetical protein
MESLANQVLIVGGQIEFMPRGAAQFDRESPYVEEINQLLT